MITPDCAGFDPPAGPAFLAWPRSRVPPYDCRVYPGGTIYLWSPSHRLTQEPDTQLTLPKDWAYDQPLRYQIGDPVTRTGWNYQWVLEVRVPAAAVPGTFTVSWDDQYDDDHEQKVTVLPSPSFVETTLPPRLSPHRYRAGRSGCHRSGVQPHSAAPGRPPHRPGQRDP
jgi:hypothetical protein